MDDDKIVESRPNDDTISLCGIDDKAVIAEIGKDKSAKDSQSSLKPLSNRQKAFCKAYVDGNSLSDCVRIAKYKARQPHNTANQLMKSQDILNEIQRQRDEIAKSVMMDKPSFIQLVKKYLGESKQESTKARLLQLYGDLLGYTKTDQPVQVNLFQHLEEAKGLFNDKTIDITDKSVFSGAEKKAD
jgi:phage terminase small subunit